MTGIYRGPASSVAAETVNLEGDKGDITVSGAGEIWTIDNDVVTYAKMQNVTATDKLLGRSSVGSGDVEEVPCTAAGRALLDDASSTEQRTTLGLGSIATQSSSNVAITGGSVTGITDLLVTDGGTGASDAATARTNLGVAIGTNVLAYDANLQGFVNTFTLPTIDAAANTVLSTNGTGTLSFVAQGGVPDGDKGDITVATGGTVWTVDPLAITAGKLATNSVETTKINDLAVTTAKIADSNVTTAKIADANVTTSKIADNTITNAKLAFDGGAFGYRNRIINGGMQVAQAPAAITLTAGLQYSPVDMMLTAINGGTGISGTCFQGSSNDLVSGKYLEISGSWTTGQPWFLHRVASINCAGLNSKTITISCKIFQNTGAARTFAFALRKANTTDNFSAVTTINGGFGGGSVPSDSITEISGTITLGATDADTGLEIIALDTVANTVVSKRYVVGDWQLELGATKTPFQLQRYEDALGQCQHYFWRGLPATNINYPSYVSGAVMSWPVTFPVTMRATPTLASDFSGATLQATTAPSFDSATPSGGRLLTTSTAVANNANIAFAVGNYLQASARL